MHVHVYRWMRIFVCLYVLIKCYCPTAEGGFGQGSSISCRRASAEETTGPCTLGKLQFVSSKSTKLTILNLNIESNLDILIENVSFIFSNLQEKVEAINQALVNEYEVRRKMLLKRLDVTVQSFGWSVRAKVQEVLCISLLLCISKHWLNK